MLKTTENSDCKQNGGSSVGGRLKQKIGKQYRYTREELLSISLSQLSLQRPAYLSTEFDNEDGKFQPDKWLEYCWVVEGIESRPNHNARRKEKLKQEVLDVNSTVLSPQRRGFSSGCRAASPHKNDVESERLGTSKSNWRSGAGFMLKNSTGEFKSSFKNSNGEVMFNRNRSLNNAERRGTGDNGFKLSFQSQGRNRLISNQTSEEKVPEWIEEGPTSMHDMIELKGFDDEKKDGKRMSLNKVKKDASLKQHAQNKAATGKSSVANRIEASVTQSSSGKLGNSVVASNSHSPGSPCSSENDDKLGSSFQQTATAAESEDLLCEKVADSPSVPASLLINKLPHSDAEFAAIMGLLDSNDFDPLKERSSLSPSCVASSGTVPCSRLSRFFSTANKSDTPSSQQVGGQGDSNNNESSITGSNDLPSSSNPLLQKIFESSRSASPMHLEMPVSNSMPGVVRAEDLEKGFHWEASRGTAPPPSTSSDNAYLRQLALNPQVLSTSQHQHLASYLVSKGNPLGDPHQQAQLMTKLNRFAVQQDASRGDEMSGRNVPSVQLSMLPHTSGVSGLMLSNTADLPHYKVPANDSAFNPQAIRPNMDLATLKSVPFINQNFTDMQQSSQQTEISVRNMLASLMASSNISHGSNTNAVPNVSNTQTRTSSTTVPSAFMPTSVMRQMTKNNVSVEDKTRKSGSGVPGNAAIVDEKRGAASEGQRKQSDYGQNSAVNLNGNDSDIMSRLLQQQYIRSYNMRPNLDRNPWPVGSNLPLQWRAQALASQTEQQRLHALAWMRKNFDQAQGSTTNLLGNSGPQSVVGGQLGPFVGGFTQVSSNSAANVYKYQSPLEKLLQSAGVSTKQSVHSMSQNGSSGDTNATVPSIISRLPPQANCISVEELEKQYASS
uniref:NOT2_3_5 domain-containing protein n=1 Tax=Syphacia muris TaxID=451379 RepID=A0A0N5AFS3_9BILA